VADLSTSGWSPIFKFSDRTLDLPSYSAIWHRRPGRLRTATFCEPWIDRMVENETKTALNGIIYSLPCLWVNFPRHDFACLDKMWHLNLARQAGLQIPKTIVTNDPDRVRSFFDECNGQVVQKLISELTCTSMPVYEMPSGIGTISVNAADLDFLEQVKYAPHLFQERINKDADLRVTIVGQRIFCARIDSQKGSGKLDWRLDYLVNMESCDLPSEVEEKSITLMRSLGLNYGAIDFCLSDCGDYVFLEINSGGQYLGLEERCNLKISEEIARLLAGEAEPLVASLVVPQSPNLVAPENHGNRQ
jgi:glutathione synthase/RimK-type ligase-like ATP-grasp enzyme